MKQYNLLSPFAISALVICVTTINAEIVEIRSPEQFNTIISTSPAVVVKYSTQTCHVCKKIKDPFHQVANNSELSDVKFVHVDIEHTPNIAHDIEGVPTFEFFVNGKKVKRDVGVADINTFKDSMTQYVKTNMQNAAHAVQEKAGHLKNEVETDLQQAEADLKQAMHDVEKEAKDQAATAQQPAAPAADQEGMLEKLKMVLVTIVLKFKELFNGIINWIKGLFGK